jgi:molybdopterin-guanine dinucleotide biosynthesis protein A
VDEGLRKIDRWTARHGVALASWPIVPLDPFLQRQHPDDLAEAERLLALHGEGGC